MKAILSNFFNDEDGAITVDFVVLTAAICLLGFTVILLFSGGATDLANSIRDFMLNVSV